MCPYYFLQTDSVCTQSRHFDQLEDLAVVSLCGSLIGHLNAVWLVAVCVTVIVNWMIPFC